MSDYDSPWKEALERFLPAFLVFFFPRVHAVVDWSRGYKSEDAELQKLTQGAKVGPRRDGCLKFRHRRTVQLEPDVDDA